MRCDIRVQSVQNNYRYHIRSNLPYPTTLPPLFPIFEQQGTLSPTLSLPFTFPTDEGGGPSNSLLLIGEECRKPYANEAHLDYRLSIILSIYLSKCHLVLKG